MNNWFGRSWFGGGAGLRLPKEGLLSYIKEVDGELVDTIGIPGSRLIDSNATGSYEVEQGHSCSFDGVMYGKLVDDTGADTSVTLTTGLSYTYKFSIALGATGAVQYIRDGNSASNRFQVYIDATNNIVATGSVEIDGVASTLLDTNPHNVVITGTGTNEIFAILGATYLFASQIDAEIWDEELIVDGVTVFSNFLAQQSDIGLMESAVGPNVQLVSFPANYIHLDNTYGHTWSGYSEYVDADNVFNAAGSKVTGKIPEDPTNPGYDVVGNLLTNPGTPQRNARVYGYTGNWDGVAYGDTNLSRPNEQISIIGRNVVIDSASSGTIRMMWSFGNSTGRLFINTDNNFYVAEVNTGVSSASYLDTAHDYRVDIDASGNVIAFYIDGQELWSGSSSGTDGTFDIAARNAGFPFVGTIPQIQIYDSTDTLIHDWIVEGDPDVTGQNVIYDRVGNNPATLQNHPDPFFTVQREGSQLLAGGFELGTELWPIPANPTTGLSALGQPLTHAPGILTPDHPVDIEMIPNVEGYEADQIAGNQYYEVDGTLKQVDAANIATNQGDTEFFGLKGIAIYTAAQVAATVTKILKYIKPFS